jgi:hypothetical protein
LHPSGRTCTVELVAVNAVLAGAPAAAMSLLCAAVRAIADPVFDLAGINTTTASVVPAMIINGPIRRELGLSCGHSAFGGMAGPAPAIGRALRLVVRNVAGQEAGVSSESVLGQPGRVTGNFVAEWEEESPWPGLAERRGVPGNAVTLHGALGTTSVFDIVGDSGMEILEMVGKSLGYIGSNNFGHGSPFAQQVVALNPVWAKKIAQDIPSVDDVCEIIYRFASQPLDAFPPSFRPLLEAANDVQPDGRVYLMDSPDDLNVIVCGGKGNLHGMLMPGMSGVLVSTKSLSPDA